MKKIIGNIVLTVAIPVLALVGVLAFKDRFYSFFSLAVVVLACIGLFMSFERKEQNTVKLVIIAVMTALSVVGRIIFAAIPFFKPVTAVVVLTAIYFGRESGFICGAVSALISNFYFGQGPWTPFQMITWGIIGYIAGIFGKKLIKNKLNLSLYGVFSGILFSVVMDIWTVIWADGTFNLSRYSAALLSGVLPLVVYAVSNVIFLLFLAKPVDRIFSRLKQKYNI